MPLLPSASDSEPFLILTDQDYRKALSPEAAPEQPKRASRPIGVAVLALVGATLAATSAWRSFRPKPSPLPEIRIVSAPVPLPPEPPPPQAPDAPASAAVVPPIRLPEPPPEPEPVIEEPGPATPPPTRGAWNGGQGWIRVQLRMEDRGRVQESQQKTAIVWDGAQFVVMAPPSGKADLWRERLQILLNLPWTTEGCDRSIASTSKERLRGEGGEIVCERVEGQDRFPQQPRDFVYWVSPEFQAGAVQARVSFPDLVLSLRVLAYGPRTGGE